MIIALAGRIKTGKTKFADTLVEIDGSYKRIAFADALKALFSEEFDVPLHVLHDIKEKEQYRFQMVEFGDRERAKDPYVFCKALAQIMEPDENYVVDDMRRIEELETLFKMGAKPYKMDSGYNIRKDRGWKPNPAVDMHPAEAELDLSRETYEALGGGIIYNHTNSQEALTKSVYSLLYELYR